MTGTSICIVCTEAVPLQNIQNHMSTYHPFFGSSQPHDDNEVNHSDTDDDDCIENDDETEVEATLVDIDKSETNDSDIENDIERKGKIDDIEATSVEVDETLIENDDKRKEESNDKVSIPANKKSDITECNSKNGFHKEQWLVNVSIEGKQVSKNLKHPIGEDKNSDKKETLPTKCHYCKICKEKFSSQKLFLRHKNLHDKSRKYPCDLCSFRFKRGSHLNKHKRSVHKVKLAKKVSQTSLVEALKVLYNFKAFPHLFYVHNYRSTDSTIVLFIYIKLCLAL